MREIKFRAWHVVQNRMYSADELGADQLTLSVDGRGFINVNSTDTRLSTFGGEKMIPLQFTGLYDKNGKEIYEGDVLFIPDEHTENILGYGGPGSGPTEPHNHLAPVLFRDGSYGVAIEDNDTADVISTGGFYSLATIRDDLTGFEEVEVIGNIYEDDHLLADGV